MYERNNRFGKMHYYIKPSFPHTLGDVGLTEWREERRIQEQSR